MSENSKKVKLRIRAEICYSNLNNVSLFLKFTNCNLLFYMPNLDDDTLDPILEDYLHFDEQLRIYPNNFTLPRTWLFDRQVEAAIIDQKKQKQ